LKIEELKAKLLDLLESDIEFRYAVAGKLGILELLKRLDAIESLQAKILDEIKSLREKPREAMEKSGKAMAKSKQAMGGGQGIKRKPGKTLEESGEAMGEPREVMERS